MARKRHARSSKQECNPAWCVIKGLIILILGLALWSRFLSLEVVFAIIFILVGLKLLLRPLWKSK